MGREGGGEEGRGERESEMGGKEKEKGREERRREGERKRGGGRERRKRGERWRKGKEERGCRKERMCVCGCVCVDVVWMCVWMCAWMCVWMCVCVNVCIMWGEGVCGETIAILQFRGVAHRGVGWVDLEVCWGVLPPQFSTPALQSKCCVVTQRF